MSVRIYQPPKSAMQSGKGKTKHWLLEFEPENTRFIEPIMGWTGNSDMRQQLNISFKTLEKAECYAKSKELDYNIIQPNKPKLKMQAYSDNFQ